VLLLTVIFPLFLFKYPSSAAPFPIFFYTLSNELLIIFTSPVPSFNLITLNPLVTISLTFKSFIFSFPEFNYTSPVFTKYPTALLVILIIHSLILISVNPVDPVIMYPSSAFELILNVIFENEIVPDVIVNFPLFSINNSDLESVNYPSLLSEF
jgi:hypothetical protein